MYSPDSLYATFSFTLPAWRRPVRNTERSPPSTLIVVPCDWNGDFVITWSTPLELFGPYSADAGPRSTSIRSMSSLVPVNRNGTFTRNDGTPAKR